MDGGVLSNLPIEPALRMGATEIIALDLNDPSPMPGNGRSLEQSLGKLVFAVIHRQVYLETALAEAQGVPVHCIELKSTPPTPIWDFSNYRALIQIGYQTASFMTSGWVETNQPESDLPSLITENQPI